MIAVESEVGFLYPEATLGVLVMRRLGGVPDGAALDAAAAGLLATLQERFGGLTRPELRRRYPLDVTLAYFKKFNQTNPVQHQLESVLAGRKSLTEAPPLPRAMFLAEMEGLLLTSGHDLDRLEPPFTLKVAAERLPFIGISGREMRLTRDDVYVADRRGVVVSVLQGPEERSPLTPATRNALFLVFGLPGCREADLAAHLDRLESCLRLAARGAETAFKRVLPGPASGR